MGAAATYQDIKHRRISNNLVVASLLTGMLFNLSFLDTVMSVVYIYNLLFAAFLGFFLWYVWFWNAGDGKLLLGFVAVMPIELLSRCGLALYAYDVIFYTFVPVFFVLLFLLLIKTRPRDIKNLMENYFSLRVVGYIFIAFFSFHWIISLLNRLVRLNLNMFLSIVLLFLFFSSMERVLKIDLRKAFIYTAVLRVMFDFSNLFTISFWQNILIHFVVFIFFVYFVLHLAFIKYAKHVKVQDLKPGMLLAESIVKKGERYVPRTEVYISLFSFLVSRSRESAFVETKPSGLTIDEVARLKKLQKEGKLSVGAVLVQNRLPFAPFLFLGVVLSLFVSVYSLV